MNCTSATNGTMSNLQQPCSRYDKCREASSARKSPFVSKGVTHYFALQRFNSILETMASSGAAEKPKFHEGTLKPYPHEEHGRQGDVS